MMTNILYKLGFCRRVLDLQASEQWWRDQLLNQKIVNIVIDDEINKGAKVGDDVWMLIDLENGRGMCIGLSGNYLSTATFLPHELPDDYKQDCAEHGIQTMHVLAELDRVKDPKYERVSNTQLEEVVQESQPSLLTKIMNKAKMLFMHKDIK